MLQQEKTIATPEIYSEVFFHTCVVYLQRLGYRQMNIAEIL